MVGAGLLINLLAPPPSPQKRRKSSQAEARADQEIFFPQGKKNFLVSLTFYILLWQRQKTLLLR